MLLGLLCMLLAAPIVYADPPRLLAAHVPVTATFPVAFLAFLVAYHTLGDKWVRPVYLVGMVSCVIGIGCDIAIAVLSA